MKKKSLKKLAFLGVATGLLLTRQAEAKDSDQTPKPSSSTKDEARDPNGGNLGYHLMTEDDLLLELNDEGIALYNSLNAEGKALTLEVASSRCNEANVCKGLNACKTDTNECAGMGTCKHSGKCAISDKNLAVKLVAEKMKRKREGLEK